MTASGASWPGGGLRVRRRLAVTEPATLVTDYMLALACGVFTAALLRRGAAPEWTLGFALGGISALLGGTSHGFREYLSLRLGSALWLATLLTFGASAAAFGAGAVSVAAPSLDDLTVRLAAVTVFGIFGVAALHDPTFGTAGRLALLMLATFAAMSAALALRGATLAAALAFACVVLNSAGIVIQMREIAPHPRFNHNDLFHLFQLAALCCLYAAVIAGI